MSRITGAVKVGGVVGQPVAHSLSPFIHNLWLETAGVDGAYVAFGPKDAEGFDALLATGRAELIAGVNVTAPFKEQAFARADQVTQAAKQVSSANILAFREGRIHADSSDGAGVLYALAEQAPALNLDGAHVVMLGAGGASRAASGALVAAGARLSILNRTHERARALADDLGGGVSVATDESVLESADLVINALSVPPHIDLLRLPASAVVMDMTYRPVVTPFLAAAKARDLTIVDGLAMLIGQAGAGFEAIFGQSPPDMDMRAALMAHLGETA
jgi:shikimate dehydrogenase